MQADMRRNRSSIDKIADSYLHSNRIVFAQGHSLYKGLEDTICSGHSSLFQVHVEHPMALLAKLTSKLRKQIDSSIVFVGSIWGETGASYEVCILCR